MAARQIFYERQAGLDNYSVHFQTDAAHSQRVLNALLAVQGKTFGKNVQDFFILGDGYCLATRLCSG